eukprot:5506628-Prymnesium_polylepis.1
MAVSWALKTPSGAPAVTPVVTREGAWSWWGLVGGAPPPQASHRADAAPRLPPHGALAVTLATHAVR